MRKAQILPTKKYAVTVVQKATCKSDHALNGSIELRNIKARNRQHAIILARRLLKQSLGIDVTVPRIRGSIFIEKPEYWL